MATYKVLQDIEAEDKLLGPLTLRQFIYAGIAAVCLFLCYEVVSKGVAFLLVLFLPPALFAGFFAFPWGRDQPTELWALAKIRFFLKPHRRIWDQSGIKELVTITAPKKIETNYTDGLSQTQVKSRLKALADTLDSRGWVVKNINVNLSNAPTTNIRSDDRLIDTSSLPVETPIVDIGAADDMLDEVSSPVAQHFNQMIIQSNQNHRQQVLQEMKNAQKENTDRPIKPQTGQSSAAEPNDYWFLNQPKPSGQIPPPGYVTFDSSVVAPGADDTNQTADETTEEKNIGKKLKARHLEPQPAYSHLRTLQPLSEKKPVTTSSKKPSAKVTATPDPAILNLASNNDLNVETIARQANKDKEGPQDEVVISLH